MGTRYRIDDDGAFFITTTSHNFLPIFHSETDYEMGIDSLKFCSEKYNVLITAFVFMPNHWHGVLWQEGGFDVSGFMRDFKRFTSVQIRKQLIKRELEKPFITGKSKSDRKTYSIWKPRFDVVLIKSINMLKTKVNYIHNNPLKKQLVDLPEKWRWSSARFYILDEDVGVPIYWIG